MRAAMPKKDQDYMDYILVNHASVPDRTSYILDHTQENFYPYLKEDIEQQSLLKPEFMVMVCNTAHYFYDDLKKLTTIPLIHMPHTAIQTMAKQYPDEHRIGLIATKGTLLMASMPMKSKPPAAKSCSAINRSKIW